MTPVMSRPTATEIQGSALDRTIVYSIIVLVTYMVRVTLCTRIGTPLGLDYHVMSLHHPALMERTDKVDIMQIPDGVQPLALRAPTIERSMTRSPINVADAVHALLSAVPARAAPPAAAQAQRQVSEAAPIVAGAAVGRKIKVSRVLDPLDNGLVVPFTPAQVSVFYANRRALKHG